MDIPPEIMVHSVAMYSLGYLRLSLILAELWFPYYFEFGNFSIFPEHSRRPLWYWIDGLHCVDKVDYSNENIIVHGNQIIWLTLICWDNLTKLRNSYYIIPNEKSIITFEEKEKNDLTLSS